MQNKEWDLDAPANPDALPDLSLGDLLKYAPILQEIILAVEGAIEGGALEVPVIKFKLAGKRVTYGPSPLKVTG